MELVPTTKMKRKLLRLEDIGGGGQEDRSIRRRVNLVGGGEDSGLTVVQHQQQQKQDFSRVASSSSAASGYGFVVLLPDGSVVKLQIDGEKADPGLSVKGFVELVRRKLSLGSSSNSKLQQTPKRQIYWGSHVMIQDLSHNLLEDGAFFPPRHCEPVRTLLLQVGPDSALIACAASFSFAINNNTRNLICPHSKHSSCCDCIGRSHNSKTSIIIIRILLCVHLLLYISSSVHMQRLIATNPKYLHHQKFFCLHFWVLMSAFWKSCSKQETIYIRNTFFACIFHHPQFWFACGKWQQQTRVLGSEFSFVCNVSIHVVLIACGRRLQQTISTTEFSLLLLNVNWNVILSLEVWSGFVRFMTDCKEKQSKEQQIFLIQKLCLWIKKFASSGLSDIYVNLFFWVSVLLAGWWSRPILCLQGKKLECTWFFLAFVDHCYCCSQLCALLFF